MAWKSGSETRPRPYSFPVLVEQMAMQNIQRNPSLLSISDITVAIYSHGKCFAGLGDDVTKGAATGLPKG
ncbi:hypothetical protein [Pseudomonas brassicacearum]|uniref:Uncharacterized protein n=1 Tax=Pseudomonas brassicacearum TaxID=930166 RepID=A0A423GX33_9PSED|nr:hypothetical protein [Pseudomonas brassicacearum]RON02467.1 hypothetical protein BK658_06255 [Pseudomonas brassicacearum]